ncbi:MAG: hypothetical protein ABIO60_00775 [Aquaticitalea sp.]
MRKPLKITLIVLFSIVVLAIVGVFVSNAIVKSKIEKFLNNSLPQSVEVTYTDIDVSTISGRVAIINPKIKNFGKTLEKVNSTLEMDTLIVDGFGYWDYWTKDKITVSSIQLRQPKMNYYHTPPIDKKKYSYSKLEHLTQNITVNRVNVQNGQLVIREMQTDSLLLKTENFTANVMDVQLNERTVKNRIPFIFKDYNVHFDTLFYHLSEFENVSIKTTKITTEEAEFHDIKMHTKYSRQELSKLIAVERDHFDVNINSIVLKNQIFGYKNDSIFFFTIPKIIVDEPNLNIYRNKLVADDNSIKPLYSKMLRNLNFDLTLSTISLNNGTITYSEKIKTDAAIAQIHFSKIFATIDNISNTYVSPEKTSIAMQALFMEQAPMDIEWYFDVNEVNDHFIFKADIGKLDASKLNVFTEPSINVRLDGELNKIFFTIDGYDDTSTVDLKLNYEDFKVIVMQKKEKKKNKLLSAVANIFIKKDSEKETDNFRNGSAQVTRDKTKSVFNFIWLNTSQSLLDAMTGSGKK